jgi:hypothetical protein
MVSPVSVCRYHGQSGTARDGLVHKWPAMVTVLSLTVITHHANNGTCSARHQWVFFATTLTSWRSFTLRQVFWYAAEVSQSVKPVPLWHFRVLCIHLYIEVCVLLLSDLGSWTTVLSIRSIILTYPLWHTFGCVSVRTTPVFSPRNLLSGCRTVIYLHKKHSNAVKCV